jgi:ribonuclease P protein component
MKNTVKNKATIDKLFTKGKRFTTKNLMLRMVDGTDSYMVTVSSKVFKRAVDRNRIKRLMRESIRTVNIKGTYVLIYIGKDIPVLDVLKNEINEITRKIGG